ncbi:MAG: SigE family polymerase sigma factor [Marmoricola sp.]|jgi:RNA polymerase sigma-70 factor (sigma-E family)|nr:SigE family polymerase sigma factor [Marmoricola sp.]
MRTRQASRDADFEAWMVARHGALLRTAYLLTGDSHSAEDLVQTSLAKLYLAWDRVQDREHIDAYARRILVNEHRSGWRRPWRKREVVSEQVPERGAPAAEYDGESDALWDFVSTLPPKQRAVIVLRYYEQLSEAETADVLGVSVGTIKSQASRALATLRSRVDDHPELSRREEDR